MVDDAENTTDVLVKGCIRTMSEYSQISLILLITATSRRRRSLVYLILRLTHHFVGYQRVFEPLF